MIQVTIYADSEQCCQKIDMVGHAGLAKDHQEGQEAVCAAVSALALNMANSVEYFTDDHFEAWEEEEAGEFHFRFTSQISFESRLFMNSLILGLQNIEKDYGEPYITIRFKEV